MTDHAATLAAAAELLYPEGDSRRPRGPRLTELALLRGRLLHLAGRRGPRLHPEPWQLLEAATRLDHVRRYGPNLEPADPATLRTAAAVLRRVAGVLDAGRPWRPSPLVFATRARETMLSPDQRRR